MIISSLQPESSRAAILPVMVGFLEELFCLPEGYKISTCFYNGLERCLYFTLTSNALPETQAGHALPRAVLRVTAETLPDQSPEYKRITTEVELL